MVESAQLRVIERLCTLTGTSVEPNKNEGRRQKDWIARGCTEHCPEAHVHHEGSPLPPIGRWTLTGAAAAVVLHSVVPFMVTDGGLGDMKDESLANVVLSGQGSGATKAAIRRLAALGWPLPPLIDQRFRAEDEAPAGCWAGEYSGSATQYGTRRVVSCPLSSVGEQLRGKKRAAVRFREGARVGYTEK